MLLAQAPPQAAAAPAAVSAELLLFTGGHLAHDAQRPLWV
jgi:hypothetical protein